MAVRRYSKDDLLRLRESPLVQKPENLPAIEQWIDETQPTQNISARRQPQSKVGGESSPMGNFSTGLRPSLMPTRSTAKSSEDISLGPPRTMFPSSRNMPKRSDFAEKATPPSGGATPGDDQEAPRSRFFGDKSNRKTANEKEGRDNRDSWTSVRERRAIGGDEEQKQEGRYNRRDRDQDGERKGERQDGRWGHRDDRRQNGERQGGWRDRERDRKDRDWDRGAHTDKEPEWMEDPAPPSAEDDLRTMGMPRNQEQFQRWKEAMSGKKAQTEEVHDVQAEPVQPTKDTSSTTLAARLKLEGVVDKPFGGWADGKSSVDTLESASTPAKSAQARSKSSRFASMFKETQPKEDTPPADTDAPKANNGIANGSAEDEAGFKRILQMLGGTGIHQPEAQEGPSSPPPKTTTNGSKQKSRFTGFFDQTQKSPERMQSPPEAQFRTNEANMHQGDRGLAVEPGSMFGGRLQETKSIDQTAKAEPTSFPMSPGPMPPQNGSRELPQPPAQRMNDISLEHPPSRGAATPDLNIQNLLASRPAQRPQQGQDKNSEFLLNLLQTKGSRPSSQQAPPDSNFPLWLEQPPNMPEPHAPKPRAPPPPGLFEDQLLRNAPPDPPRQEHPPMPGNQMPQRRTSQRAPPGFYDEQNLFVQQQQQAAQRRNFTEPPQQHPGRRMSGHPNLPQMQIPQPHQQFPGPPPEFLQSPGGGHQQVPPPGFNPHMPRHPPGFHNIPNIFQPPQQQGRELPPGYTGGGMPVSAGGMQSPPNAPPGFFGGPQGMPPGFMQMRSPTDGISTGAGPLRGGGRGFDGGYDGGMGAPRR